MRNPERLYLTMLRIKRHQLFKEIRYRVNSGGNWRTEYLILDEKLRAQGKLIQKMAVFPLLLFLLSYSVDFRAGEIGKIWGFPVAIPVSFALLTASAWSMSAAILSQSIIVLLAVKSDIGLILQRKRCDSSILEFLEGGENWNLVQPIGNLPHFKIFGIVASILLFVWVVIILFYTLGTLALFYFLFSLQCDLLYSDTGFIEKTASVFGMILVICGLLFPIAFNFPIKIEKATENIRWGMLIYYHKPALHPRAKHWH